LLGQVVIGDTGGDDSGVGCPIWKAEVCLVDLLSYESVKNSKTRSPPVRLCVETEPDGAYSLPALIGSLVSVEIKYSNHTFEPVDKDKKELYENGIKIEAGKRYLDNDFKDGECPLESFTCFLYLLCYLSDSLNPTVVIQTC